MRVRRFDYAELAPPTRTADGFLIADGYVTRAGVFTYRRFDGAAIREYRPPEAVLSRESLDSFAAVPLTLEHPPTNLRPETVRNYQVGSVSRPERVGMLARATIRVTDPAAIAAVEGGLRQLSCGYECEIDATPGEVHDADGGLMAYDVVQRDVIGNHVALVERGRAGPSVGLRLDSDPETAIAIGGTRHDGSWTGTFIDDLPDEAFALILPGGAKDSSGKTIPRSLRMFPHHLPSVTNPDGHNTVDVPMLRGQISQLSISGAVLDAETRAFAESHLRKHAAKLLATPHEMARSDSMKVKIGGIEYDTHDAVGAHLQKTEKELAEIVNARAADKAEFEKVSGRLAVLEGESAQKNSAEESAKRQDAESAELSKRFRLLTRASLRSKKHFDELTRMDSSALMREIISTERPEIKLDGRSDEFLTAALELIPAPVNTSAEIQRMVNGVGAQAARQDAEDPIEKARASMIAERQNAWRAAGK